MNRLKKIGSLGAKNEKQLQQQLCDQFDELELKQATQYDMGNQYQFGINQIDKNKMDEDIDDVLGFGNLTMDSMIQKPKKLFKSQMIKQVQQKKKQIKDWDITQSQCFEYPYKPKQKRKDSIDQTELSCGNICGEKIKINGIFNKKIQDNSDNQSNFMFGFRGSQNTRKKKIQQSPTKALQTTDKVERPVQQKQTINRLSVTNQLPKPIGEIHEEEKQMESIFKSSI